MSKTGSTALALALGAGGGFFLWYLLRADAEDEASSTDQAPAVPSSPPGPPASSAPGVCSLRLDASGLTADGAAVDVAGAVARCQQAGRAELVLARDAPATIYMDLGTALSAAKVPLTLRTP